MARRRKKKGSRIPLPVLEKRLADLEALVHKRRGRTVGREAFNAGKKICKVDRAISEVRKSAKRGQCSPKRVGVAERLIAMIPSPFATPKRRALARASLGVDRACHERRLARIPKDPKRIVRALEESVGEFAYPLVDPDDFPEHLSTYLPKRTIAKLETLRNDRKVPEGIAALIRAARPRTWIDLEKRPFRGAQSVLEIIREYPGLGRVRLPDQVYGSSAALEWSPAGVPF